MPLVYDISFDGPESTFSTEADSREEAARKLAQCFLDEMKPGRPGELTIMIVCRHEEE